MAGSTLFLLLAAQTAVPGTPNMAPAQDGFATSGGLATACMDVLGNVGSTPSGVQSFDGTKLKKPDDIARMRKSVKSGAPILIDGGSFRGADFRKAKLRNVCFRGSNLAGTRWDKADANGVAFVGTDLTGASLSGAIMSRVLFRNSNLANAQAVRADFSGGRIDGGWSGNLSNFNLDSAQLTAFDFNCFAGESLGCPFDRKGITARGADLTGAKLSSFNFWELNLQGAKLDRTEINVETLRLLGGASIAGPIFVRGNAHMVTIGADEVAQLLAALPAIKSDTVAECDIDKPQKLDDLLCSDPSSKLSNLVRDMAKLEAMEPTISASGIQIYNTRLSACFTTAVANVAQCAENSVRDRREKLAQALGSKVWLKQGEKALFARVSSDMASAYAAQPKLAKLSPAIAGASSAYFMVQLDSKGLAKIRGLSLGGNGEACKLSVNNTRRWASNGWYSAAPDGTAKRGFSQPVPIARIWKDRAEIYPPIADFDDKHDSRISNYISCNDSNLFSGMMVRLPIIDADFDSMWATLENTKG
jgi:uncharacterized protein YjbI with pentapeptide repeats